MQSVECPHCGKQTGVDEKDEVKKTYPPDTANPLSNEPRSECYECGKTFAYKTHTGLF